MAATKIGVFPAAGGIGGFTVKHLLKRVDPKNLVFVARYPSKLESAAAAAGATVRRADYDNNSTLEHAFDGVDTLFLISYASVEHGERFRRQKNAVDAAIKSGVKYIFYGSLGYSGSPDSHESLAHVMQAHLDTERYLEVCAREHPGFDYTNIREGLYSESYPLYTAFFNPRNPVKEIRIPHDGSGPGIAWVKREELSEGTAEILTRYNRDPEGFNMRKQTVLLSGSKVLTLQESVDILSDIAKQPVSIKQVPPEEYHFSYNGADYSKEWVTSFDAFRRGEGAFVSPLLTELLGREPEDFRTTVSNA